MKDEMAEVQAVHGGESKGKDVLRSPASSSKKHKKKRHDKAMSQRVESTKDELVEAPLSSRSGRTRTERKVKEALSHHAVTMEQMCYNRAEVQQLQKQVDALHAQVNEVSELVCGVVSRHSAESSTRFDQFDRLYSTAFYQMEQLLRSEMDGLKMAVTSQLKNALAEQQTAIRAVVEDHAAQARQAAEKVALEQKRSMEEYLGAAPRSHAGAAELLEARLRSVRQDVEAEVMETVTAHLNGASEKISQELLKLINERLEGSKEPDASSARGLLAAIDAPPAEDETETETEDILDSEAGEGPCLQKGLPTISSVESVKQAESDETDYDSDVPPTKAPPPPPADSECSGSCAAGSPSRTPEAEAACSAPTDACPPEPRSGLSSTDDTAVS